MTTLRTDRLVLRRWHASDREPFAALCADPVVMEHFPATLSRAESDALVDTFEERFEEHPDWGLWVVERAEDRAFLGLTGLNPLREGTPAGDAMEVGWRFARHAWGHGYATEAARAALVQAFDIVGLAFVTSITAVTNMPSQAVMRRLGMRHVADFAHPALPADHPLAPHVLYRLEAPVEPRLGHRGDVAILHELRETRSRWLVGRGIEQWRPGEVTLADVERQVDAGEWWVVPDGERVAGGMRLLWSDPTFWPDLQPDDHAAAGYVHGLVVDPRAAGRGLGAALLQWAGARVAERGRRLLRLDCAAGNPRLRAWYRSLGFTERDEVDVRGLFRVARMERPVGPASEPRGRMGP